MPFYEGSDLYIYFLSIKYHFDHVFFNCIAAVIISLMSV